MSHEIRILVVDPDAQFCAALAEDLGRSSEPATIVAVQDADAARAALTQVVFSAAVVDLEAPAGSSGLGELVGELRARYPGLPVIAVAQKFDEAQLRVAASIEVAGVLPKPFAARNLTRLLFAPSPDAGFAGECAGVSTAMLLALHCGAAHDGVLHLWTPGPGGSEGRVGSIHLEDGQPVHAMVGERVGAPAVHELLGWRGARASWIPGRTRCARTIVGRWEGLLVRSFVGVDTTPALEDAIAVAYPDVVEKTSRLAQTPDVLGAFLLRRGEILTGACVSDIDQRLAGRALKGLSRIFYDMAPESDGAREIQSIMGGLRLVIDQIGPPELGFQVGVVVKQAAPICKSLRRLLRQIDRAFAKSVARAAGTSRAPREDTLHRVA